VGEVASVGAEEDAGGGFEVDADFGALLGHAFAGTEVEGDAFPAPVVDEEFDGGEGFGLGIGGDAFFLAIAVGVLAVDLGGLVLAADGAAGDFVGGEGLDGAEDFVPWR
jgi:hypothetical protein